MRDSYDVIASWSYVPLGSKCQHMNLVDTDNQTMGHRVDSSVERSVDPSLPGLSFLQLLLCVLTQSSFIFPLADL